MSIYEKNGYADRKAYLQSVAEEFELPYAVVSATAAMLGPSEDFDGLISMLEDYQE